MAVLVAMTLMLAMMLASTGTASAADCGRGCENPPPGSGGGPYTGALHANYPNAALGIATAKVNSLKHLGCDIFC